MEITDLIKSLDTLLYLVENSKRKGSPDWKRYNDYYISVCKSDDVKPILKGTVHYMPDLNDIRDEKINILLG